MCEIVRAAIASGLFSPLTTDVTNIPFEALNLIDCPGIVGGPKICAVNSISYYKSDMWTIMLSSMGLAINGFPKWVQESNNNPVYEPPADPGVPLNRTLSDAANKISAPTDPELQRLIASSKDFVKIDNSRPDDPWQRTYVRYSKYNQESIESNAGWKEFKSGDIELVANLDSFVIGYTMVSGFARKTRLAVRLRLDDVPQISTRMIQGYMDYPSITTAFISKVQVGTHLLQTQYRVSDKISLDTINKDTENIITGFIVIPGNDLYMKKIINPGEIILQNDNAWANFPALSLQKLKFEKTCNIIVLYNISMPGYDSHLVTRVDINTIAVDVINNVICRKVDQSLGDHCIGVFITHLSIKHLLM